MTFQTSEPLKAFAASCNTCRHVIGSFAALHPKCRAFPDGIPIEIIHAYNDHKTPYPGDNGIQYEPDKAKIAAGAAERAEVERLLAEGRNR